MRNSACWCSRFFIVSKPPVLVSEFIVSATVDSAIFEPRQHNSIRTSKRNSYPFHACNDLASFTARFVKKTRVPIGIYRKNAYSLFFNMWELRVEQIPLIHLALDFATIGFHFSFNSPSLFTGTVAKLDALALSWIFFPAKNTVAHKYIFYGEFLCLPIEHSFRLLANNPLVPK